MQVRYSGITGMGLAKIALVCIIGLSCLYSQEIPARIEIRVPIHLEVDDEQSGTIAFLDLLGNTVHLKHAVHIKLRTTTPELSSLEAQQITVPEQSTETSFKLRYKKPGDYVITVDDLDVPVLFPSVTRDVYVLNSSLAPLGAPTNIEFRGVYSRKSRKDETEGEIFEVCGYARDSRGYIRTSEDIDIDVAKRFETSARVSGFRITRGGGISCRDVTLTLDESFKEVKEIGLPLCARFGRRELPAVELKLIRPDRLAGALLMTTPVVQ